MDTSGATKISPRQLPKGASSLSYNLFLSADAAFRNLVQVVDLEGAVAIYLGDRFELVDGALPALPVEVQWRLFHGPNDCVFETTPIAGSTFLKGATPLVREGLLFQVGGTLASQFMLAGRIAAAVAAVRLRITATIVFRPGLPSPFQGVTVGSMLG